MALIDDYNVNLANQWREIDATAGTFYTVQDLYSLDQDLADELGATALPGYMAYPTAFSANTPTDIVLKSGTYLTQDSYFHLRAGSIQTSGFDSEIYLLTLASAGYTNAIAGDIFKVVTGSTSSATGVLLDYDNTSRKWWVRVTSGTFADGEALTIGTGTGAGTTEASGGVLTGEDGHSGAFGLGTVAHWEGTYFAQGANVFDLVTDGWYAAAPTAAFDILIKIQEAGSIINSGTVIFYNRVNRDAANAIDGSTTGDTYDWFQVDLSSYGANPVPLSTRPDLNDTLTNAQAEDYLDGTTSTIAAATAGAPYAVDVDQNGSTENYDAQLDMDNQSNLISWSAWFKYFFRKGNTTLLDGVEAQTFRFLDPSYAVVKESPAGTIAGGAISFARGWVPANVGADDASNYNTTPAAGGNPVEPPTFRKREATNVPVGAKVTLFLETAPGSEIGNTAEFTLATGNNSGNGTLVVNEAIPLDKPSTGFIRAFDDVGNEDRYAYTSFSGFVFTLSGTLSKNYPQNNNAYVGFIDTTATGAIVAVTNRYVSDRNVVLRVRLGSGANKMEDFTSSFVIGDSDSSIPTTVIADTINNN